MTVGNEEERRRQERQLLKREEALAAEAALVKVAQERAALKNASRKVIFGRPEK